MSKPEKLTEQEIEATDETLKGTFVSVMLLGAVIFLSWMGVWLLFLSR